MAMFISIMPVVAHFACRRVDGAEETRNSGEFRVCPPRPRGRRMR
jgi:hypothetical protein